MITIDGIRLPAAGNIYPGFRESVPDGDYLKNDFSIPKRLIKINMRERTKEYWQNRIESISQSTDYGLYQESYCTIYWDQPWNTDTPPTNHFRGKCVVKGMDIASLLVERGYVYAKDSTYKHKEKEANKLIKDEIKGVYGSSNLSGLRALSHYPSVWLDQFLDVKNKKWKSEIEKWLKR